jgi:hypothetical protein
VAAIAVTGAVAARVAVDDPVVALEQQWQAITADNNRLWAIYDTQYARLPAWAKPGPDGRGAEPGWPDVSDLPEFRGVCSPHCPDDRVI